MEERVLYGYMDGDCLQCIEIAPIPQKIRNEKTGEITTRMVSVIEQVAELPTIYKPVDAIDESKQNSDKEGYVVRIVPYDLTYISTSLEKMTELLLEKYGDLPLVFAGGVMSNTLIKTNLVNKFSAYFANPEFSCDNAAGIAIYAYLKDII